ncbi:MAG: T9SS type A sorting domain-containing protein [Phaeodactylibacter sp.]|nr:T9SS type A sorting domain-containing protein [Phaeodactylibacter sp.]
MERRLLLYLLTGLVLLNPSFTAWANSPTFFWVGGFSNNWEDEENWVDMDSGIGNQLPTDIADVMIDGSVSVILSTNFTTGSIQLSGGATLTIAAGATLFTVEGGLNGSHGIRLDQTSPNTGYQAYIDGSKSGPSALIVNGHLIVNDLTDPSVSAPGTGMYILQYTSVTVGSGGSITITNASDEGIKLKGSLVNNGTISINNSSLAAISTSGAVAGSIITNNGMLAISGAAVGLDLGSVHFDNNAPGTVVISDITPGGKLVQGSGQFRNYGTFGGNGTVSSATFKPQPNSTISPGASIGTLTFDSGLDLDGVTLFAEINAPNAYDRLIVQGAVLLDGGTLSFGGTYSPTNGEDYLLVHSTTNGVTDKFSHPTETEPVTLNSTTFNISYTGDLSADVDILVNSTALPVELLSFAAQPKGGAVLLSWATATETNSDYFSVEHSTDGRHFREIGRVAAAGASLEKHDYSFTDFSPHKGLNYYRLDEHDLDGAHAYSPVRSVVLENKNAWSVTPTLAHQAVAIEWQEAPAGKATVEVFNLAGQQAFSLEAPAQTGAIQIPVEGWAPGMYLVVVQHDGLAEAQRFVKE